MDLITDGVQMRSTVLNVELVSTQNMFWCLDVVYTQWHCVNHTENRTDLSFWTIFVVLFNP